MGSADALGITHGLCSTVHADTNFQSLTDQPMQDRRDAWAAAENVIPISSGAAQALGFIWPGLKIRGKADHVPVRTGSIAELNLITERTVTVDEVNDALRKKMCYPQKLRTSLRHRFRPTTQKKRELLS